MKYRIKNLYFLSFESSTSPCLTVYFVHLSIDQKKRKIRDTKGPRKNHLIINERNKKRSKNKKKKKNLKLTNAVIKRMNLSVQNIGEPKIAQQSKNMFMMWIVNAANGASSSSI